MLRRDRDAFEPDALIDSVADLAVPRALRHYAERWHAELVVVGSHASAPNDRAGDRAASAPAPLRRAVALALPRRGLHRRSVELAAIGVGYDDGPEAHAALDTAGSLARATGAKVHVRTVIDDRIPALSIERPERWAEFCEAGSCAPQSR
jgi:nucleotide-binding universal stress UspA family protein